LGQTAQRESNRGNCDRAWDKCPHVSFSARPSGRLAAGPLTPSPSPARGEGRRFARKALLCNWCQLYTLSPLAPCGRGVGGEGDLSARRSEQA
jgi:hypothetical protein